MFKQEEKLKCYIEYLTWISLAKSIGVEFVYNFIQEQNHGKLILPSEYSILSMAIVWFSLDKIYTNPRQRF